MTAGPRRRSSLKVLQHSLSVLVAGFVFRPFMFFVLPGVAILAFAAYVNLWVLIRFFGAYAAIGDGTWVLDRASGAVATAFARFPHTFVVGGLSLMLGIQLMGLGILAMQNKKYFRGAVLPRQPCRVELGSGGSGQVTPGDRRILPAPAPECARDPWTCSPPNARRPPLACSGSAELC